MNFFNITLRLVNIIFVLKVLETRYENLFVFRFFLNNNTGK